MRPVKLLAVSLFCLLCLGCVASPPALRSTDIADPSKGVLLTSVTYDGFRGVQDGWFFYRREGESQEYRLDAVGLNLGLPQSGDFPQLRPTTGRLLAIPLEPGRYELSNWMLYVWVGGGYGYISPRTPPPPLEFTISAGNVTYLGGLHIDTVEGRNFLRITIPVGGIARVTDQQQRDLPLLGTKFPNLADWPVTVAVPAAPVWSVQEALEDPAAEPEGLSPSAGDTSTPHR